MTANHLATGAPSASARLRSATSSTRCSTSCSCRCARPKNRSCSASARRSLSRAACWRTDLRTRASVSTLVVAALSARLLAQSAQRAGWRVVALDLFGDVDTCAAADEWHSIGDPATLRVDGDLFLAALESARAKADCIGWIAGAGFEPRPDLLDAGARVLPLLGNDRTTIERMRDPRRFFAVLAERQIPHPETTLDLPAQPLGWLVKDFATSGGWYVRRADATHVHNAAPS